MALSAIKRLGISSGVKAPIVILKDGNLGKSISEASDIS
ncbi:MAG: hypothetical protein ACI9FN_003586 [Saprospiraceae bacterium]|jgi:hypothetical protein